MDGWTKRHTEKNQVDQKKERREIDRYEMELTNDDLLHVVIIEEFLLRFDSLCRMGPNYKHVIDERTTHLAMFNRVLHF